MRTAADASPGNKPPDEPVADDFPPVVFPPPITPSPLESIPRDSAAARLHVVEGEARDAEHSPFGAFDPWAHTGWIARGGAETWPFQTGAPASRRAGERRAAADLCAQLRRSFDRREMAGFDRYSRGNPLRRVSLADKSILNSRADVNQLFPVKYRWAWERYLGGARQGWAPQAIDMTLDARRWRDPHGLDEGERRIVRRALGFFASASALAAGSVALGVYRHVTNPECRLFLLRQAFEAGVHAHACQHIVTGLELDAGEIFNMCHEVPSIRDRNEFLLPFVDTLTDPDFHTGSPEGDQKLLVCLIAFYGLMLGLFFVTSVAPILALARERGLPGIAQQYRHVAGDLATHREFGIELIRQIRLETPAIWTEGLRADLTDLFRVAVGLDYRWIEHTFGLAESATGATRQQDVSRFKEYSRFVADRCGRAVGLGCLYPGARNPFPSMTERQDETG